VQEAILAEELVRGLHPLDGQDLSMKLEKICACVDGIKGECATETGQLMQLAVDISNTLVELVMLPV
jgi:hypothetical protein